MHSIVLNMICGGCNYHIRICGIYVQLYLFIYNVCCAIVDVYVRMYAYSNNVNPMHLQCMHTSMIWGC